MRAFGPIFALSVVGALAACTLTTTSTPAGPVVGVGPQIPAANVGGACSGVGTSPGDTATFSSSDCPAGVCVADLRTDLDSYCSADCTSNACPSGFTCQKVTFGDPAYACLKSGAASGSDGGASADAGPTCAISALSGSYTESFTTTDANCPPQQTRTMTVTLGKGFAETQAGCTSTEDANACTLSEQCTTDANGATVDLQTTLSSSLTGTLKALVTSDSDGTVELNCSYSVTLTKS